jgi:cytochrome c553
MATMRTHAGIFVVLVAAALAAAGCGGTPAPDRPTYSRDIQPLMTAHCIRCHGAGGTLNKDPDIPGDNKVPYVGAPTNGYLTQLADTGPGKLGLMSYATTARPLMTAALPYMPPPPAPPLTDREYTTLVRWLDNPLP